MAFQAGSRFVTGPGRVYLYNMTLALLSSALIISFISTHPVESKPTDISSTINSTPTPAPAAHSVAPGLFPSESERELNLNDTKTHAENPDSNVDLSITGHILLGNSGNVNNHSLNASGSDGDGTGNDNPWYWPAWAQSIYNWLADHTDQMIYGAIVAAFGILFFCICCVFSRCFCKCCGGDNWGAGRARFHWNYNLVH